ncbi:MAG: EutN/CcmL family microcompartment protein [bacterium]|nr:ethanolamine utilization protein EutN [Candidatus Sumerlaeota bacterium]
MDIARVIGTIVATRKTPSLDGCTLCIIQPLNEKLENASAPLIATDATNRRGHDEVVYYVASGDAVFTGLQGEDIPVDAAIIGIVDSIDVIP